MRKLKNQKDTNFTIAYPFAIMMEKTRETIEIICGDVTIPEITTEVSNDTCHHRLLKKKTSIARRRLMSVTDSDHTSKTLPQKETSYNHQMISRSMSSPDYIDSDDSVPEMLSRNISCSPQEISTFDLQSRLSPLPSKEHISSSSVLAHRVKSRSYLRKIESTKSNEDSHELSNCFDKRVADESLRRHLRLKFDYHPNVSCRVNYAENSSNNVKKGKSSLLF